MARSRHAETKPVAPITVRRDDGAEGHRLAKGNIQRKEYSRFKLRQSRRTRRIEGEGQLKDSEEKRESLESYFPTSAGRDNDMPSSDEDDRRASFEGKDQNLRTRANAFTRQLNECLEDIREQKGVIEAIYRGA